MFFHQDIGLDKFNRLAPHKAQHALYECCNSVAMAGHLAHERPFPDHEALFRSAEEFLFALTEDSLDDILEAHPTIGRRPGSAKSCAEQCAVWDDRSDFMAELKSAAKSYEQRFGFGFVMFVEDTDADGVRRAISDRLHHDTDTERKVVRIELAKINRTRLERMLGPEGGYPQW